MKFLLVAGLLISSGAFAAAADVDTYCLSYLNGKLNGQKPPVMEDFEAVADTMSILDEKQPTIRLKPTREGLFVSDVDTSYNKRTKVHTQKITMATKSTKPGKDKDVKEYTIIIERDQMGNIKEIRKRHILSDLQFADKIEFQTRNGICFPNEQRSGLKRDFKASLCHELENFFAANKDASACIKANYAEKLRKIISDHQALDYKPLMSKTVANSVLLRSGHELSGCAEAGLSDLTLDEKVWKVSDDAPAVTPTAAPEETEED